jgi:hypothetical protein
MNHTINESLLEIILFKHLQQIRVVAQKVHLYETTCLFIPMLGGCIDINRLIKYWESFSSKKTLAN